jgi:hypothetical protein
MFKIGAGYKPNTKLKAKQTHITSLKLNGITKFASFCGFPYMAIITLK